MITKRFVLVNILLATALILTACKSQAATPTTTPGEEPVELIGEFTYSNEFAVETYYVEQAVALNDMRGFVLRDMEWELPVDGQVLGYMAVDYENNKGTYTLQLPIEPKGTFNDVDHNGQENTGVQIFVVGYSPNLTGGPYSEGDDRSFGWPGYLASIEVDTENQQEVIGGKLVVWAPDAQQQFPTAFGDDGLLFSNDDPVGSIPAGWSVIDLDQKPFVIIREKSPSLTLYEPSDVALKDYSTLSYTEAFKKMFEIVKKEYAFNGIKDKQPDWDKVYAKVYPMVEEAEQLNDAVKYYYALKEFTLAFKDGHVGLSGGDIENQIFQTAIAGGYGFAIRELDDGRVIVTLVVQGGPAEAVGMKVGAEMRTFNEKPILEALRAVVPFSAPHSNTYSEYFQQDRYLLRAPLGTPATFSFINPESTEETKAAIAAIAETVSFQATSIYVGFDYNALPVTYQVMQTDQGAIGYVKINSNYDDLNLIIRLFERALKTFEANAVAGLIIDMRQNSGGANLGLAGFLYSGEIPLGQLEYYSEESGKFEPDGPRDKVLPNLNQYSFPKMALLVDQACASACELEAYGFSKVPGMEVIGIYPTGGIEAEVARGQFVLPEGFSLQVPTGRFTLPDGSIFLEGTGVQPTIRIPIDEATVLSEGDPVLDKAIQYVVLAEGAGVVPAGDPVLLSSASTVSAINTGSVDPLEFAARESYPNTVVPGETYTYTIPLPESQKLLWYWGWCTNSQAVLDQNFSQIALKFTLNGTQMTADKVAMVDQQGQDASGKNLFCRSYGMVLDQWPVGEHHLQTEVTFKNKFNDGTSDYPAGKITYNYTVFVAPK
jgi:C-terminal processing protease CtpA/Prc